MGGSSSKVVQEISSLTDISDENLVKNEDPHKMKKPDKEV